jgi:hypothetical protein
MDCDCLIHPFQNDPGTSQSQRVMECLLSDAVKIDARSMADLLNYFVQMSRHINYYDLQLNIKDWQPFFRNTPPFTLASIINFPLQNTENKFSLYKSGFDKKPSGTGLQLIVFSIYYRFINNINEWDRTLKDSGLPIAATLEGLIKNRLQAPVKQFIMYSNAAVKSFGVSRIEFTSLYNNPDWDLNSVSLAAIDTTFSAGTVSDHKRLINLYTGIYALLTIFFDVVKILAEASEKNMEESFVPLKEDLQKKHPPHLALLFAFLNMFRQLQNDLNKYTRKHLDYFYKEILQFKAEDAIPDRANIIFGIQKALMNYLIKKGIKVKGGKDENKQEILFSLDDDIVVNQTSISDKRTLFLNNQNAHAQTYVEGVYIAPVAEMADGVEKEFEDDPKNFPTLGAHYSKYIDPETKFIKPYPNARIGFILASPVLFLQEGSTRTIRIDLPCLLDESICSDSGTLNINRFKDCCKENTNTNINSEDVQYPDFYKASNFFTDINNILSTNYYYVSEDIIKEAQKNGISSSLAEELRKSFLTVYKGKLCNCEMNERIFDSTVPEPDFNALVLTDAEKQILSTLIKPRRALNFLFSGEKEWMEPSSIVELSLNNAALPPNQFYLHVILTLKPDKGPVTFYNKEVLGEDFETPNPLVKIQLDDKIKISGISLSDVPKSSKSKEDCCIQTPNCCLLKDEIEGAISLYHFFRNVTINQIDKSKPVIQVDVCGLKNFIVQNDESVMDVNSPIMAFGARPKIDSNFYIGSEEIFLKKWTNLWINLKWKDLPDNLEDYYVGYQNQFWDPASSTWIEQGKIKISNFLTQFSLLEDGKWYLKPGNPATKCSIDGVAYDLLFQKAPLDLKFCFENDLNIFSNRYTHQFQLTRSDFQNIPDHPSEKHSYEGIKKRDVNSRCCFIRLTLKCQDFQHYRYPFILARQMAAAGKLPDLIAGAVYFNINPIVGYQVLNLQEVFDDIKNAFNISDKTNTEVRDIQIESLIPLNTPPGHHPLTNTEKINYIKNIINKDIDVNFMPPPNPNPRHYNTLNDAVSDLQGLLSSLNTKVDNLTNSGAVIPNEPYTPTISTIVLDYSAFASIEDIDLIHLHPYQGTYKHEEIELKPALLPTFCDEGTLFLGLKDLIPGENLNILFQMAEATSDSESDKEFVYWHYLESNIWKPLRTGFEVLDDGTKNLTSTGIIKFSLPANMSKDNTVMPKDLFWIKATIPKNSGSVSETTGILPQAVQVIFTPDKVYDKLRLSKPLSEKISKLDEADASVKSVTQPYDSFGGLVPEIEQQFYVRVSETLRHKGRAVQSFDYERLVLQAFPQLFKVKCINHSFALNAHEYINDFPYAGGYVLLAVIPDLNKLKAGNSYEPKVPVSMIEDINVFIRKRTSPFVRFRAMNPRYEKINFCLTIKLMKGKDENYFREKVKDDLRNFLAPWAVGDYYKLTFGQCVYRSDIIQLLETGSYVDFISDLRMGLDGESPNDLYPKICPTTPRSILIAGSIEVCIYHPPCKNEEKYYDCGKNEVMPCATKPEIIADYCKKQIKKQING